MREVARCRTATFACVLGDREVARINGVMPFILTKVSLVMRRALLLLSAIVVGVVGVLGAGDMKQASKKLFPPGMHPALFPEAVFDPNSPACIPGREPCGFYSFSLHGGQQLKWIKSWCQCDDQHECSYDRTDMKMRVYRHVCVAKTELDALTDALFD